jgi:Shikimate kinase
MINSPKNILQNTPRWSCPICGPISEEIIKLYDENMKYHNFTVYPLYPTCLSCGSEIIFDTVQPNSKSKSIIVLTGTCGSGKTSTAQALMHRYGFYLIDGDCVINLLKNKFGIKNNGIEEFKEISKEIDILLSLDKNIVLSHVILQSDIRKYQELFVSRHLKYKFFVLHPSCSISISRTKTRTCFKGVIDEKWVKYFYDELNAFTQHETDNVIVFDNSSYSVEESADKIVQMFNS